MKYIYVSGSTTPTIDISYIYKDHLGSTDTVIKTDTNSVTKMSFDSFGSRRNVNWVSSVLNTPPITLVAITDKGYTGHEQLDDVGLIHMNGRVYDPVMGRFLSADPNIQAPTDTQSLNRYAYVLNNPLSATDPSGYFGKKLRG
ncbi:MAG TPA: RHS repeat-associated core domain-containing protein, partial [Aeromonadales bacterium]|nr:RHS repeat-associated core domain-containing protein [Aeromonadales bacterium]